MKYSPLFNLVSFYVSETISNLAYDHYFHVSATDLVSNKMGFGLFEGNPNT